MAFDPKAYLAKKSMVEEPSKGFDPKSYLSSKRTAQEESSISELESAARGAAQGLSFGFADEGAGALGALSDKLSGKEGDLSELYKKHRDESRALYDEAHKANPKSYTAGEITGGVLPAFLPGVGAASGASTLARLGRTALAGGAFGLGNSNADLTKGEVGKAALDTAIGAGTGALLQHGAEKLAPKLSDVGQYLRNKAENLAVTATGATGNQASKFAPNAGRELLDSGIVGFGNTPRNIADKASQRLTTSRNEIDSVLKALDEQGIKVSPEEVQNALSKHSAELSEKAGTLPAFRKAQGLAEDVAQVQGKNSLPLSELESQKRSFGKTNWADPDIAQAQKSTYRGLRDLVEEKAAHHNPQLANKFQTEKKAYETFSPIQEAAERRANQLQQSPVGGILDVASAGGALMHGNIPLAIAAPIARRAVAPRLASSGAVTLDTLGKALQTSPQEFGKFKNVLLNAASKGPSSLAATHYILAQTYPEYRELTMGDKDRK